MVEKNKRKSIIWLNMKYKKYDNMKKIGKSIFWNKIKNYVTIE